MDYKDKQTIGSLKLRLELHSKSLKSLSESCKKMSKELERFTNN